MKSLFFGIVLILLIGIAGFFYRNVMERTAAPEPVACTMDAKVCPDGSSVGRVPPSCEFAPCPAQGSESRDYGISYSVPEGYAADGSPLGITYGKPALGGSVDHTIRIRRFAIPEGQTAEEVILANTRYQPADMQAEDFERFETESIGGKEFRSTVIERFEAIVHSAYFLARADDVLMFEIVEHDVTDWMEPTLSVKSLPEHAALREMLRTLQTEE